MLNPVPESVESCSVATIVRLACGSCGSTSVLDLVVEVGAGGGLFIFCEV